MTESTASKLTTLCTAVAVFGALVGLMVNSGHPGSMSDAGTTPVFSNAAVFSN